MPGLVTFKVIATGIAKPFVMVSRAFQDMFAVIKAKIVRQTTHKRNFIEFAVGTSVETTREKWGATWTTCPAHISPTTPFIAKNFDVETGSPEAVDDRSLSLDTISCRNGDGSASPIPKTEESIHFPIYQCTRNSTNMLQDVVETPTQNIRVVRARAKRHSILFGDDQKPGLAESVIMLSDTSLDALNVFARSELQQKRILCARTIRHEKLFSSKSYTEAAPSKSEGTNSTLVEAALSVTLGEGVVTEPGVVDHEIELDFGYLTADSYDDLPTPPSTPSRRARIVKSDSYGGSINYSLRRLSRNTQDFEDIMLRMKQRYEVPSTPTIAQHPIDLSLSS